jgi:type II secretory pathway pseudopilin PulG
VHGHRARAGGGANAAAGCNTSSSSVHRQALAIVQQRLADANQLQNEYRDVLAQDRGIEHTLEQSQRPENGPRNRYVNVLPYDYNRIKLSGAPGYINASQVSYASPCAGAGEPQLQYIAAQGPVAATVEEFWRMCLEKVGRSCMPMHACGQGHVRWTTLAWPPASVPRGPAAGTGRWAGAGQAHRVSGIRADP